MDTEPAGAFRPVPRRRDRLPIIGALVMAVTLTASGLVIAANASGGDSLFPAQWDPRVAPIAAKVAKLRGLKFEHPVTVKFLSPKEFEEEVGVDESALTEEDRVEIEHEEAALRASGWIGNETDLLKAVDTARRSSTLALYSFQTKQILVRGSKLDAQRRVTLAHELVHVLQDQHFDLAKLQREASRATTGDESVFTGLVEGDAVRIEEMYLDTLSAKDKAENDRLNAADRARINRESDDVPEIVQFALGAPYSFGPATATVLAETDGDRAINDALTGPVPTSRMFIQPGDITRGVAVEEPQIPAGTSPVGDDVAFEAFELYLLLATQIDARKALHAADGIAGGRQTSFQRGHKVCVRTELAADRGSAEVVARDALREWAATRPRAASVRVLTKELGFEACDPGKAARAPAATRFRDAGELLGARMGITIAGVQNQLDGPTARCAARVFVTNEAALAALLEVGSGAPNAEQSFAIGNAIGTSAATCRADTDAGLP